MKAGKSQLRPWNLNTDVLFFAEEALYDMSTSDEDVQVLN